MKLFICLGLIAGTFISMNCADRIEHRATTSSTSSTPPHHQFARELLGALSDGDIGQAMKRCPNADSSHSITFPLLADGVASGELYSVDEDGSGGKEWLGRASGTVTLPNRGCVFLALPPDRKQALALMASVKQPGIHTVDIPAECMFEDVILTAAALPSVQRLQLYGGALDAATVKHLTKAEHLHSLVLMNVATTPGVQSSLLSLRQLGELKCIGMTLSTRLTSGLSHLQRLSNIDFDDCHLPANSLADLVSIKSLRMLRLANTGLTDRDCAILVRAANLESLRLERNPITDDGLRMLSSLRNLRTLELKLTNITDESASLFTALPKLTTLDLSYTRVTGSIAPTLAGLPLSNISLTGTDVADKNAIAFSRSTELRRLVLDDTEVSDATIDFLRNQQPAAQIY